MLQPSSRLDRGNRHRNRCIQIAIVRVTTTSLSCGRLYRSRRHQNEQQRATGSETIWTLRRRPPPGEHSITSNETNGRARSVRTERRRRDNRTQLLARSRTAERRDRAALKSQARFARISRRRTRCTKFHSRSDQRAAERNVDTMRTCRSQPASRRPTDDVRTPHNGPRRVVRVPAITPRPVSHAEVRRGDSSRRLSQGTKTSGRTFR